VGGGDGNGLGVGGQGKSMPQSPNA
jgi:hypothetical protein